MYKLATGCLFLLLIAGVVAADPEGKKEIAERAFLKWPEEDYMAVNAPPEMSEEYTGLVLKNEGARIRLDWVDTEGNSQWVHWEDKYRLNVIVMADVERTINNRYIYKFHLSVAPNSPQPLAIFTLAADGVVESQTVDKEQWHLQSLPIEVWKNSLYQWRRPMSQKTAPGQTTGVLWLESSGLPGISKCWASSGAVCATSSTELPGPVMSLYADQYKGGLLENAVHGVTVGPQEKLPKLVDFVEFLRVSREQGWVAKGTAHENLKALVDAALKAEKISDHDALRVHLKAVEDTIDEYLAADPPQVTTEVQALLGLNAAHMRKVLSEGNGTASGRVAPE